MQPDSRAHIVSIVQAYFEGLHYANAEKLRAIFSADCVLKAPGVRRNLDEWLELVKSRPVPAERGDGFNYAILNLDVMGEQAMVKVYCPLLGSDFIDFLGLLYEDGQWLITNKMYANQPGEK